MAAAAYVATNTVMNAMAAAMKVMAAAEVLLLLITSLGVLPPASAVITYSCNGQTFAPNDDRLICVYHLLERLVGDAPVKKGRWYDSEDCVGGTTIYGYRRADGGSTSGCLYEVKHAIDTTYCHLSMGARAYDDGCYMRFELYWFNAG